MGKGASHVAYEPVASQSDDELARALSETLIAARGVPRATRQKIQDLIGAGDARSLHVARQALTLLLCDGINILR